MNTNEPRAAGDSIDRVINDVARRITAIEPPADLRARIMSRLGPRDERAPRWWTSRLVPVAAGFAAVAVLAIALSVPRRSPDPIVPAIASPVSAPVESARATDTVGEPVSLDPQPRRQTAKASITSVALASDDELAWLERTVPALVRPDAISVEGIQPETLTIAHIEMKPLVPGPLAPASANGGGFR